MPKKLYYFDHACEKIYYQRLANRPLPKSKFSSYRGVQKSGNPRKPYRASFRYAGRSYYIGSYVTEVEAALAYNKVVKKVIGEHALLNDIESELSEAD